MKVYIVYATENLACCSEQQDCYTAEFYGAYKTEAAAEKAIKQLKYRGLEIKELTVEKDK